MNLLAKVSKLKHRLTARRSLGGLLVDRAAVRSEMRRSLNRKKRKRVNDCSRVASVTDDTGVFSLAPSRDGNRIQVTSERAPGKLLGLGVQQIERLLAHRGGANGETGEDELASFVCSTQRLCFMEHTRKRR